MEGWVDGTQLGHLDGHAGGGDYYHLGNVAAKCAVGWECIIQPFWVK